MKPSKINYLDAMGIQTWHLKKITNTNQAENLTSLSASVAQCTACPLHNTRTQTVFGAGNARAELMIIGETPGLHEDQTGEPFMGHAGQLLNRMLQAIGLDRHTVYLTNILKCRPPNNHGPLPNEINQCAGFLEKQIALIQPKLLLALGDIAAQHLLKTPFSLTQMRGKFHTYGPQAIPLLVTYHPAYLLCNPQDKRHAWQDLQSVQEKLQHNTVYGRPD